ncbi:MAG TPA: type II secretion system protein [Verrucomicrobiae bacterium]|nr:type II secretion system protein [Verrucomicrobiae bacterium]
MKRREAFTLSQLLVLIAAGAVAGVLLLASLDDAKEKVQAAACMSNLREISLAVRLYTDDNGGYMPPASYGAAAPAGPWDKLLGPYLPLRGSTPTSSPHRVFDCPSANYPGFQNQDLGLTYSCTAAMLGHATVGSGLTSSRPRRQDEVLTPAAQTPLVFDCKKDPTTTSPNCRSNIPWNGAAPFSAKVDLNSGSPASCTALDFRHNNTNTMNIAFFDGSVRSVTFTQAQQFLTQSLWEGR